MSKARKRCATLTIAIKAPTSLEEAKQMIENMREGFLSPPSAPKSRRVLYDSDDMSPSPNKIRRRRKITVHGFKSK